MPPSALEVQIVPPTLLVFAKSVLPKGNSFAPFPYFAYKSITNPLRRNGEIQEKKKIHNQIPAVSGLQVWLIQASGGSEDLHASRLTDLPASGFIRGWHSEIPGFFLSLSQRNLYFNIKMMQGLYC